MPSDKPTAAIQENLLCLLMHNDEHGRIIAHMVDPQLFEGDYYILAERCITYWRQHRQAPKLHTADLVADIIEDKKNKRATAFRNILLDLHALAPQVNTAYVLDQLRLHTRLQKMKGVLMQSAERLNAMHELALPEVEQMWQDLLRAREISFDPGVRLDNYQGMLERLSVQATEFVTGITELDNRYVTPARETVMILIGGAGRGKSWFLVHIGKHAMLRRKKILHVTLELSQDQVHQRYYQAVFGIPKREVDDVGLTVLELDKTGSLENLNKELVQPAFALNSSTIKLEMNARVDESAMGVRMSHVIVKGFPMRSITVSDLRAYLDDLETTERFIPDMLILDYIGILKTDPKNHRISLGRELKNLRGLCAERHIAGVTAHQVSKAAVTSGTTHATHIAEDWSMVGTADTILAFSCTDEEYRYGLARLYVSKSRDERDRFGVLLTQNYTIGQFVLSSTMLTGKYFDLREGFLEDEDWVKGLKRNKHKHDASDNDDSEK